MALIKTIDEFKTYVRLHGTIPATTIIGAVPDAQDKYIRPILGDTLCNALDVWYNAASPTTNAAFTALLPYVQRALSRFTLLVASPEIDVNVSDAGIGVVSNNNLAPASKERVAKFDAGNEQRGWDNIETLLRFLEANKTDYPLWVSSSAYTMSIRNLVNSAEEFNKIFNISESRLLFYRIRNIMDDVDNLTIKPAISTAQFDAIIAEIRSGTLSTATQAIIDNLRRAEVYFTIAKDQAKTEEERTEFNLTAEQYLKAARTTMDENHANYPLYEASDQFMDYTDDEVDYSTFDNTASTSKIFIAHGG